MNSSQVSSASSDLARLQMSFRPRSRTASLRSRLSACLDRRLVHAVPVMGFVFQVCDTFSPASLGSREWHMAPN